MQVLIAAHPSLLSLPDVTGSTPLHHASAHPSPHPLLYLLSLNVTKEPLDINVTNVYQRTPLHCAVAYNSVYNTDLLLRQQADPQLCDNEGKTPIDYARELEDGADDILAILEGLYRIDFCSLLYTNYCTKVKFPEICRKFGIPYNNIIT